MTNKITIVPMKNVKRAYKLLKYFNNLQARFTNDFHGTRKNPNVRFERRVDEDTGEHRLGIFVLKRKIKKGEELLISYGHNYSFS